MITPPVPPQQQSVVASRDANEITPEVCIEEIRKHRRTTARLAETASNETRHEDTPEINASDVLTEISKVREITTEHIKLSDKVINSDKPKVLL